MLCTYLERGAPLGNRDEVEAFLRTRNSAQFLGNLHELG